MNKDIVGKSTLNCYLFFRAKQFGRAQGRNINAISEVMQQEMEIFFNRLGPWIDYIIKYGSCVEAQRFLNALFLNFANYALICS